MRSKLLILFALVALTISVHAASYLDRRPRFDDDGMIMRKRLESEDSINVLLTEPNTISSSSEDQSVASEAEAINNSAFGSKTKREPLDMGDLANILNDVYVTGKVTPEGVQGALGVLGLAGVQGQAGVGGVSGSVGASIPNASASIPNASASTPNAGAKEVSGAGAKSGASSITSEDEIQQSKSNTSDAIGTARVGALLLLFIAISTVCNAWYTI